MTPASRVPASPKASKRKRSNGLGSVYLIVSRNKWAASIYNIHGKRVTKHFECEEQAWAWLDQEKRAKNLGQSTVALNPNQTLKSFLYEWVERNSHVKKPSTTRNYRERIQNQIVPTIGNIKISEVTPRTLETFILDLTKKNYKAGTIKGVFRTLSAAFSDGYRLGDIPINPMERVKLPKLKSIPLTPIPEADAAIIYSHAAQDPYMHARVELGMVCGIRPGEVLGLLWSDLNFDAGQLEIRRQVQEVRGKGLVFQSVKQDEERTLYLSEIQINIFRKHKESQDRIRDQFEQDEGLLFPNKTGRKLDHRRDDRMWQDLLKLAGVQKYARYQMRKTAFTRLYAALRDTRLLMEYSGHTQISTLMKSYVFPSENSKEAIRKSIDSVRPITQKLVQTKDKLDD